MHRGVEGVFSTGVFFSVFGGVCYFGDLFISFYLGESGMFSRFWMVFFFFLFLFGSFWFLFCSWFCRWFIENLYDGRMDVYGVGMLF